jgi:hypothetical protein
MNSRDAGRNIGRRLAEMQHLFFQRPLEPFHMASPCKPTQLREFLGVAFKAKFTTLPAGKSKKEEASGTQKLE